MNRYILATFFGIALWLIGYVAGIPLLSAPDYMHTAETVIGMFFGLLFAVWYFGKLTADYFKEGLILGIIWLVLMVVLDLAFLLPFIPQGAGYWFATIGLSYLAIPIQYAFLGWIVEKTGKK